MKRPRLTMGCAALAMLAAACSTAEPATTTAPSALNPSTVAPAPPIAPSTTTTTTVAASSTTSATTSTTVLPAPIPIAQLELVEYAVPEGAQPHDVAPAADGGVWYTAQASGDLGWLDPATGDTRHIDLGEGSKPHGVIVDESGIAWITDGGRNSIISFNPVTEMLTEYPLPPNRDRANLNTAAIDLAGQLWFTGQSGVVGVLDPTTGAMEVFDAPRGRGPYGITATPLGTVYFASLAGSYVGLVGEEGEILVLEPPTPDQGARRVWSDSTGAIWVSEWNSGQLSRYDPAADTWNVWPLPGVAPSAYAVYVDEHDTVWVTDFGGNAIHRFDPATETFHTFELPSASGNVRQLLGRPGEVWGAESRADKLVVIRRRGG